MFGYIRPPLDMLPNEEAERFQQVYCGLCHTIGERCGVAARFILNYDFTYLAILLSQNEERSLGKGRCIAKPFRVRDYFLSDEAMALAADESVILAYWQLRDGVTDHDWLHGLKYRSFSRMLESAYQKATERRPAYATAVCRQLTLLRELEETKCASIDQAADAFASLLRSGAQEVTDPIHRRVLEQLLYHLGRWIYLIDAADDLKQDAASGNYNPVALRFGLQDGLWTPEARTQFTATLDHSIHMMTTAFELWDFGVWTPILEATLYTELFRVGRAVLDGTFRTRTRNRIQKETEEG